MDMHCCFSKSISDQCKAGISPTCILVKIKTKIEYNTKYVGYLECKLIIITTMLEINEIFKNVFAEQTER